MEKSYGVNNQEENLSLADACVEELRINGFSVLDKVLDDKALESCRTKMDELYEKQLQRFGEEKLKKIDELNIVRCPLAEDEFFLNISTNSKIVDIVSRLLGNYFILHLQNGIINKPNEEHHQSSWHRDLPYQEFISSKPLAISALFCVDDFTEESGSTFVLPYSHKIESIPSKPYLQKHNVKILAKAGSVILFDAMVFHKAGYNSANFIRRAINNVYTTPIIKQQINLALALNNKYANDPFLSKFLGYQSNSTSSELEWRNNRLEIKKL